MPTYKLAMVYLNLYLAHVCDFEYVANYGNKKCGSRLKKCGLCRYIYITQLFEQSRLLK